MRIDLHVYMESGSEVLALLHAITQKQDLTAQKVDKIMIDTTALLAAVADERTESASLIALVTAQSATMADLSAKLAAAIAANDPVAMAAVQADLDKAAADLSLDNQAAKDALAANTPPATP